MADFVKTAGGVAVPKTDLFENIITSSEERRWNREGRIFSSGGGVLNTLETVTATTLIRQQPFAFIRVPASIVIIPLSVVIVFGATGAAVNQTLISVCDNDPGTSNSVLAVPKCVNTRYAGKVSSVNFYATNTGATGTAPTNVSDLFRTYMQADQDAITGAPTPPIVYKPSVGLGQEAIVGSSGAVNAFLVYLSNGTSSTAFVIATWAEFTYAEIYGT